MEKRYRNPEYYRNRELSWLAFNWRVLEEARDRSNPLLERLKFLSITASNLDEFYNVRVASLARMEKLKYVKKDIAGLTPKQQLSLINAETHEMVAKQYSTYARMLRIQLAREKIYVRGFDQITDRQQSFVTRYFRDNVYPVLTPRGVDASRPFPFIADNRVNIAVFMKREGGVADSREFATVQAPAVLPRIVKVPVSEGEEEEVYVLLEEIIYAHLGELFPGYQIVEAAGYRVLRDRDLELEEEAPDLMKEIEKQLRLRERGHVLRLDIDRKMGGDIKKLLMKSFGLEPHDVYRVSGPLDLTFLSNLVRNVKETEHLLFSPDRPYISSEIARANLFEKISKKDLFFHHPYDSFQPVIDLIHEAATDDKVLAIKMTLYRVSGDSPIVRDLARAAENGKEVTVLVEIKARFDEENNINWAQRLESAGCHVIYGLAGLKTHCKLTLIVRREQTGMKRYMHLGTGNYNDTTAKLYTDMGLMTSDSAIAKDASHVFNMLSGYSIPPAFNKLVLAPIQFREMFVQLIDNEIKNARSGRPAFIRAKMNSLSDKQCIAALYRASRAGVNIELIVRGICCLRPGISGISENIRVHSIVGRYLEHSRIYMFGSAGKEKIYLTSADLMPRNLNRRVEIMFPIEARDLKQRVRDIFDTMMMDNVKARHLLADGSYEKLGAQGKKSINAQEYFRKEAAEKIAEETRRQAMRRSSLPLRVDSPENGHG